MEDAWSTMLKEGDCGQTISQGLVGVPVFLAFPCKNREPKQIGMRTYATIRGKSDHADLF